MGIFSSIGKIFKSVSPLLSFAGAVAPSIIGGISSARGAETQNAAARAATQKQMDFQERMASTEYQRGMADMRRAGLNPILAYKQGGAGAPSGSTYSPVNVGAAGTTGAVAGATSAIAARRFSLDERRTIAEIDKLYTSAEKDSADANLATHQRMNVQEQRKLLMQQRQINEPNVSSAKHAEKLYRSPMGDFFKWWQMLKRR